MDHAQVIFWEHAPDAILDMTKMELQLIPDPDMYIIFEKYMRGAVSYISNRISKNQSILYS